MSIFPDSGWLSALKLPTRVIVGLFMASMLLLFLDSVEILVLADFGGLARPIVILTTVVFGSLTLTALAECIIDRVDAGRRRTQKERKRAARNAEKMKEQQEARTRVLERIEHLAPEELRHLADCLRKGNQYFYTYVYSPPVTTLMSKGLVYTPGGTHNQDYYPYTIHDYVWRAVVDRKAEILERDDENRRNAAEEKKRKSRRRY